MKKNNEKNVGTKGSLEDNTIVMKMMSSNSDSLAFRWIFYSEENKEKNEKKSVKEVVLIFTCCFYKLF